MRVLIAASGTGGHLFPAIFIADAFKKLIPGAVVEFIGSGRRLEDELIVSRGYFRHVIPTVGVKHRGIFGLLEFIITLPKALFVTSRLLLSFKPDVVVGVGGYVTVLPVILSRLMGIPTWIHEAEIEAGMANSVLSLIATKVSLAFPETKLLRKGNTEFTGHPLRDELASLTRSSANVSIPPRKLLVLGGSQGAKALDETLPLCGPKLKARGFAVWHQTRPEKEAETSAAYAAVGINARVVSFIHNMTEAYSWADLVISRSGAGSVMELGAVNLPVIFVPYPFAQGNHQLANAKTLADRGKALIVEEGDNFSERLAMALEKLTDPVNYRAMIDLPNERRRVDAAERIVRGCMALVDGKRSGQSIRLNP